MAESTATAPKPSSSVKLVLLGEAAVGKVRHVPLEMQRRNTTQGHGQEANTYQWGPTPLQSSLVLRFVNNDFQENKEPTIGGPLSDLAPCIPLSS